MLDKEDRIKKREQRKANKKPFSQTDVGRFLKGAGSTITNTLGDVLPDKGFLGIVKNLISKDTTLSKDDKQHALIMLEIELKNLADARALQVAALSQEDLFSKRFIYYLTIAVISFSFIIVILLFFVEIPEKNRDVINFILGVVIGTGLTGIFQYYFGSSKGSKDKQDYIRKLHDQ